MCDAQATPMPHAGLEDLWAGDQASKYTEWVARTSPLVKSSIKGTPAAADDMMLSPGLFLHQDAPGVGSAGKQRYGLAHVHSYVRQASNLKWCHGLPLFAYGALVSQGA